MKYNTDCDRKKAFRDISGLYIVYFSFFFFFFFFCGGGGGGGLGGVGGGGMKINHRVFHL